MSARSPHKIINVLVVFVIVTALSVGIVYEALLGMVAEAEKRHPSSTEKPHE